MVFNPKTEDLMDEIRFAVQERDAHLEMADEIVARLTGRDYNTHKQSDMPITENFGFELLSVLKPSIIYDNPRCQIQTAAPYLLDDQTREMVDQLKQVHGAVSDRQIAQMMGYRDVSELAVALGGMTMKMFAKALQLGVNRWSNDNQIMRPLGDLAVDYIVNWGVALTTITDQPGYGGEELVPQMPYLIRIAPQHHVFDSRAMSYDTTDANGPRFKGHMWRADKEDLLDENSDYDKDVVSDLLADDDTDTYYFNVDKSMNLTKRKEVFAWDIWLPEAQIDGYEVDDGYIGSWRTVALSGSTDGVTKKAREIRPPRPAYVPEWGPYTMFGYHKIPNDPYPLSILVATSEKAESLNKQTNAISESSMQYKKIGIAESSAINDGERVRTAQNGTIVGLDEPDKFKGNIELGGVSDTQIKQAGIERESLERLGGLSSSRRGNPKGEVSATAEAIADQGSRTRSAGISSAYRLAVSQVFRTAAYFMCKGEDHVMAIDGMDDDFPIDMFVGGNEGRSKFRFEDLSLSIDPYSMEHTDQALLKRNIVEIVTLLRDSVPVMMQSPDFDWDEPFEALFQVANIQGMGEVVRDFLFKTRANAAAMQGMPSTDAGEVKGADLRLSNKPKKQTSPYEQMSIMQEAAGLRAAAI